MKRLVIMVWLVITVLGMSYGGWSIFDGVYKKVDDNSTKTYKVMDKIADELGVVKNNQIDLIREIKELKIEIKANAQVPISGQAGAGNTSQQTNENIGGNKIQKTNIKNDSKIFQWLFTFMTALCTGLIVMIREQNGHIKNLMASSQAKDTKIWELTNANIKYLIGQLSEQSDILLGIIKDRMAKNGFKNGDIKTQ